MAANEKGIFIPKLNLELTIYRTEQKTIIRIGSYNYSVSTPFIDFQLLLIDPLLWVGNNELTAFTGSSIIQWHRQIKESLQIRFNSVADKTKLKENELKQFEKIASSSEYSLQGIHLAYAMFISDDMNTSLDYFNMILDDPKNIHYRLVFNLLSRPATTSETKALLTPTTLFNFLVEKMKSLGTAACPPYHLAFVIGGTSAEACLKTVKLASAKYYDNLPTQGNEQGQAFRDVELEKKLIEAAAKLGIGAQFGGKYFTHVVRVIRLPGHGASCPLAMGVSCSADRNVKAKINKDGIWLEELDRDAGRLIPEAYRRKHEHGVKINLNKPMKEILRHDGTQTFSKYIKEKQNSLRGRTHGKGNHRPAV